jgi:hypothetical protein
MNEALTIRVLEQIMGWDDDTIARETTWLRLISDFKYNSYKDYLGGMRFAERLLEWLQQFRPEQRQAAYDYVRQRLIFLSYAELHHLVECFFPAVVEPLLIAEVAAHLGIPPYLFWTHPDAEKEFEKALRKTLFLGLSDGARMDLFRRSNERRITNEQVLVTTQVNDSKWEDVLKKLRKDTGNSGDRFSRAFLIDDFTGSGKTLLRREKDDAWDGKLKKFYDEHPAVLGTHFESDWSLHVHHYVCSHEAQGNTRQAEAEARAALAPKWFQKVTFTFGLVLPEEVRLDSERDNAFWNLTEEYYDPDIANDAIRVGGETAKRGFGECGLPLILEHNTPNNSVALLWADTPKMRPLFRRAQRHW